jgi:hypothetical protein
LQFKKYATLGNIISNSSITALLVDDILIVVIRRIFYEHRYRSKTQNYPPPTVSSPITREQAEIQRATDVCAVLRDDAKLFIKAIGQLNPDANTLKGLLFHKADFVASAGLNNTSTNLKEINDKINIADSNSGPVQTAKGRAKLDLSRPEIG